MGYRITIAQLKAVLKELGYNWYGPACSLTQFFTKLKEYVHPPAAAPSSKKDIFGNKPPQFKVESAKSMTTAPRGAFPEDQRTLLSMKMKKDDT